MFKEDLKCTLLSERSQSGTASLCTILSIWHSGKGKTFGDRKNTIGCQGVGRGEEECIGFLGERNYFVWKSNGGYMTLFMAKLIEMYKVWTLM